MDPKHSIVIKPQFEEAGSISSNQMVRIKVRGKWGFINFSECLKKVPQKSNKTEY
ncbi:hypothetical protein LEP1GSC034_2400 [Leptospira interrogans str. 2003000735]|nr:hypothetical protein LEP1GSC027_3166 [Leptospira interrogans str. 2002000624]EKQ38536.1 hypothetical protein LEP1GSC025_3855 [Leptospira interrogans str. 2002000621]EKQ47537.1 hypothetical protein LEP1GSC026_4559 [Leptospira interrogans str. 2002000623]EMJ68071.1 hypothetical protein LEP1GSC034_2400 [Leptospira interrogans str. 2003000735]EMJ76338.1 hypothetical protein LEP1GSC033_0268 [Leptospira interrogans str. 2002000632]EMJ77355.1 hypothetical protein LEP1GSC032_4563 [Leptospira interr